MNNIRKLKIVIFLTKISLSSNNNTIIIEDLKNENNIAYILKVFVLENNNNLSIIFSRSSLDKLILLEFTKFERRKIAK